MLTLETNRASLQVVGFAAFFGCGLLQIVSAQEGLYSTVDLGLVVSGHISLARKINVHGQVAGRTGALSGADTRAVVWTARRAADPRRAARRGLQRRLRHQ